MFLKIFSKIKIGLELINDFKDTLAYLYSYI